MIKLLSTQTVEGFPNAEWEEVIDFFKYKTIVAMDTETNNQLLPFDGHLLSIQLGDEETQYTIDTLTYMNVRALKEILLPRIVVAHNMKFDWKWFYALGIDIRFIYDTYVGEMILTTGFDRLDRKLSLKAVVDKYLHITLDKSARGSIAYAGLTPRTIEYGANDIKYLLPIMSMQKELIAKHELEQVEALEMRSVRVLAMMEYNGVLVDKTKWNAVAEETESNVERVTKELDVMVLEDNRIKSFYSNVQLDMFEEVRPITINWSSPEQKLGILQNLGLKIKSVDARDLLKQRDKETIIPKMIEYSKQFKLASSFGKSFTKDYIHPVTGMVHPDYFQIVSTGRISCSKPNLLNIPSHGSLAEKIRAAFIAKPGYKFVGGDFSNFELRIIAEFAEDPLWDKVFMEGGDLHTELCCKVFNIPVERVKDPFPLKPEYKYRDVQKTIDFGLAYGMSCYKLGDLLDISAIDAQIIIDKFFDVVPKVKEFLNLLGSVGTSKGFIRTAPPFRRIRWFPKWRSAFIARDKYLLSEIDRASRNTIPQGTNGDVVKLALCNLQDKIDAYQYPMVIRLSIYDEIQTECPSEFAPQAKEVLERTMVEAAETVIKRIPIKVDVTINDYWKK